jgi:hypothetical protein
MAALRERFGNMQNLSPGAKAILDARMQTNRTPTLPVSPAVPAQARPTLR